MSCFSFRTIEGNQMKKDVYFITPNEKIHCEEIDLYGDFRNLETKKEFDIHLIHGKMINKDENKSKQKLREISIKEFFNTEYIDKRKSLEKQLKEICKKRKIDEKMKKELIEYFKINKEIEYINFSDFPIILSEDKNINFDETLFCSVADETQDFQKSRKKVKTLFYENFKKNLNN